MRGLWSVIVVALALLACGRISGEAFGLDAAHRYELVSPSYKGGYGILHIEAVASSGESVMFYSPGVFAEAPSSPVAGFDYFARRTSSGWLTSPLVAPTPLLPYTVDRDVSPTLETVMVLGKPGTNEEGAFQAGTEGEFLLHSTGLPDSAANWELAGMALKTVPEGVIVLKYAGASPDFCHIFIAPASLTPQHKYLLAEEAGVTGTQVYDLDRGCNGEPVSLKRVGSNNSGKSISPVCQLGLGTAPDGGTDQSSLNAVADDGREAFFSTCVGGTESLHQLFVRLDGLKTLEVSKPLGEACVEVPCAGAAARASADFIGASEDGSDVFFTTATPLEPVTDTDQGNDLYMARIGCPAGAPACETSEKVVTSLVQVSHDPNGAEAQVQGVVRLASDGSRVYFVAHGDLLNGTQRSGLESEGRAIPHNGAGNMYVYDSATGEMRFVADLCTGKELSGSVEDTHCPTTTGSDAELWGEKSPEAQTTGPDGGFLVFASYGQLTPDDTDTAKDIYRYDAATGALQRVSVGEEGYDANGNNDSFNASIAPGYWGEIRLQHEHELDNRAVSGDGSRIVFTTSGPLSPSASNGLANVYEWHEGSVSLISGGTGEQPVEDVVISGQGNDVFFLTTQGLLPQDTDGTPDLYDARVEGGFAQLPAPVEPCSGDSCQGPLTNPAPLLVPGSISQTPGENIAPVKVSVSPKKKTKVLTKSKSKAKKKKAKHKAKRATRKARRAGVTRNGRGSR